MKYKIASIGAGNMGGAILKGAVACGLLKPSEIAVCVRSQESASAWSSEGYCVVSDPCEAFANAQTVMLAIKPQGAGDMLARLSTCQNKPLIISILAGVTAERISESLCGARIIRAMPNTPLLLGCGATAVSRTEGVTQADMDYALRLFSGMGLACEIPDRLMNEVIPLNGSSPAFVYYLIDALAKWGAQQGFDYQTALSLTAKAFEGAARMVQKGDDDPSTLIRKVCSPGGATLEGMAVLERDNVARTLGDVSDACVKRAYELAK